MLDFCKLACACAVLSISSSVVAIELNLPEQQGGVASCNTIDEIRKQTAKQRLKVKLQQPLCRVKITGYMEKQRKDLEGSFVSFREVDDSDGIKKALLNLAMTLSAPDVAIDQRTEVIVEGYAITKEPYYRLLPDSDDPHYSEDLPEYKLTDESGKTVNISEVYTWQLRDLETPKYPSDKAEFDAFNAGETNFHIVAEKIMLNTSATP